METYETWRGRARRSRSVLALVAALFAVRCSRSTDAPVQAPAPSAARSIAAPTADGYHDMMIDALARLAEKTRRDNPLVGEGERGPLRARLEALPPTPSVDRWWTLCQLAWAEVLLGDVVDGRKHFAVAEAELPLTPGLTADDAIELAYRRAIAELRHAEDVNCCARRNADSCVFPIRGGGVHSDREGSTAALALLTKFIAGVPVDSERHLQARWLINIVYQTLGEYPALVPPDLLIPPPPELAAAEAFPRFPNIATELGVDSFGLSGSEVADDFDDDGFIDLLVSSYDPAAQLRYFRNRGDGGFEDRTEAANLEGITGGLNLVSADFDNDGDVDVLVLRGAWWGAGGRHPNSLLENLGGRFRDVTIAVGLADDALPTQTAAWADFDLDGDLDLYVGNETSSALRAAGQLFLNHKGRFEDIAARAGVENLRFAKAVSWGDYDEDGDPDLFVSNLEEPNRLYRNDGDAHFVDVAVEAGVDQPLPSFPSWFFDYDNDGHLDLFVATYPVDIADLARASLGRRAGLPHPSLFKGDGKGHFVDVALEVGLDLPSAPMGANFGDLDNDGFLDIFLATGATEPQDLMPNVVYRNRGGKRFVDVTFAGGFGHLQKGHGVAFADFDRDGDSDVFVVMGGGRLGDRYYDALYENPGFGNHYLAVDVRGVSANRRALGARIRIDVREQGNERSYFRHVNSGGSFGASPLLQTIGLGRADSIVRVVVDWPSATGSEEWTGVPLDAVIGLTEGDPRFRLLDRPPLNLARGPARTEP